MTGFQGPKNVVISSKKYDIHRLTLSLNTLNISEIYAILLKWAKYKVLCNQIFKRNVPKMNKIYKLFDKLGSIKLEQKLYGV